MPITSASGKLSKVTLHKVQLCKKMVPSAWKKSIWLSSNWSNNKFKMLICSLTKMLKSINQSKCTTDLNLKNTKWFNLRSIFLYLSQELQSRWHLTTFGLADSLSVNKDISPPKSGSFRIKTSQELRLLEVATRRECSNKKKLKSSI